MFIFKFISLLVLQVVISNGLDRPTTDYLFSFSSYGILQKIIKILNNNLTFKYTASHYITYPAIH